MRVQRIVVVSFLALWFTLLIVSTAFAFSDVPASHLNAGAIDTLSFEGVINGYADGRFGPGDPIKRAQFAKMAVGLLALPVTEDDISPFADVETSGPGALYPDNYVAMAAKVGITKGTTPTTFVPYKDITRAQVLTMLVRAADAFYPGLLPVVPAGWSGQVDASDSTHGVNIARAEYGGLLANLDIAWFSPGGSATRAEVAQIMVNLERRIAPPLGEDQIPVYLEFSQAWSGGELRIDSPVASARVVGSGATLLRTAGSGLIAASDENGPVFLGVASPNAASIALNAASTAQALVLLHPVLASHLPQEYAAVVERLAGDPRYSDLVMRVWTLLDEDPSALRTIADDTVIVALVNDLASDVAKAVLDDSPAGRQLSALANQTLAPASGSWYNTVLPPEKQYTAWNVGLWVASGDGTSVSTENRLPIFFEGTITRSDGTPWPVPYRIPGTGVEFSLPFGVQLIPGNELYSNAPRVVGLDLPEQREDYEVSYSPAGPYALGGLTYYVFLDLAKAVVGGQVGGAAWQISAWELGQLQALYELSEFKELRDAVERRDGVGMAVKAMDILTQLNDPAFRKTVMPKLPKAGQQVIGQVFKNASFWNIVGDISRIYTAGKFIVDGDTRIAAYLITSTQELLWGEQPWKIGIRDGNQPQDKWKKSPMTLQEVRTFFETNWVYGQRYSVVLPESFPPGWSVAGTGQSFPDNLEVMVEGSTNPDFTSWGGYRVLFTDGASLISWEFWTALPEDFSWLKLQVSYLGRNYTCVQDGDRFYVYAEDHPGWIAYGARAMRDQVLAFAAQASNH